MPAIENLDLSESTFSSYEIENLKIEPILFQTGYLTIKEAKEDNIFLLNYPNQEVRISFLKGLFESFSNIENIDGQTKYLKLSRLLKNDNFEEFFETVKSIYASIPYTLISKADESFFHSLFYLMVCASGADALSEVLTCLGRIDLLIKFKDKLFILEFKCNQSAKDGINQIKEKIYLIGVNFNTAKRNIDDWKVEELTIA